MLPGTGTYRTGWFIGTIRSWIAEGASSSLTVHGMFRIHGADHELSIPVEAKLAGDHWTAHAQFKIPYVAWGMKNPSKAFLHVGDMVEVEFQGQGKAVSQQP